MVTNPNNSVQKLVLAITSTQVKKYIYMVLLNIYLIRLYVRQDYLQFISTTFQRLV